MCSALLETVRQGFHFILVKRKEQGTKEGAKRKAELVTLVKPQARTALLSQSGRGWLGGFPRLTAGRTRTCTQLSLWV